MDNNTPLNITPPHWFEGKPICFEFKAYGRKPIGVKEWSKCIWNFDIWVNKTPLIKTIFLSNLIVWIIFFILFAI